MIQQNKVTAEGKQLVEDFEKAIEALKEIGGQPKQMRYISAQSSTGAHKECWDAANAVLKEIGVGE